jgi:hypothetical protein
VKLVDGIETEDEDGEETWGGLFIFWEGGSCLGMEDAVLHRLDNT